MLLLNSKITDIKAMQVCSELMLFRTIALYGVSFDKEDEYIFEFYD